MSLKQLIAQQFSRICAALTCLCLLVSLIGLSGCQPVKADPNQPIQITLWHGVNPPPNREVLQRLVDRFNQTHPEIRVQSLYVGQGDQQIPKILSAVVGNVPPNLLWYAPMLTGQLVELDAILPLEDWLTDLPVTADIDPVLFDAMRLEEHLWSVPFSVNNVGIFYRPSLFKQAGITELPRTWAELRRVARQLTDSNGHYGMLLPLGKGEWTVFMWLPFMWSAGGEIANGEIIEPEKVEATESPRINIVNDGAVAALQFWQDLIQDGSAILSQPERGYELDQFIAGKVAMQLTGPWTLGQLQKTQIDYAVMPIPIKAQPATSIGGENLFIFKTTPEQEQASKVFAEYVMSQKFQTEWAITTGYLPVNLKARQRADYQAFLSQQPVVKVFLEQAKYGRSRPIFAGYSRLSDALGRAIESVLLGRDPKAALRQAQQSLDRVLTTQ
jgi:multiple sugar transport system substrate-binding protein